MTIQQLRPAASQDADLDLLLTYGPFPHALRAVIADRGLTLEVISRRLRARGMPVSLASLSHWQRGLHLPRPAVWDRLCPALDDLLDLAPGTVRMLLERARTPVDSHAALLSTAQSAYVLVRDVIGAGEDTFWPPVSVRQDAVVSCTGWLTSVGVSNLQRANADNVSRVCLIYVALDGRAPEQWLSTTQRVGRVATDEREGSSAVELLLDSPVSRDELVRVDSTVTWSDGPTEFSSAEPQRTVGHCLATAAATSALPCSSRPVTPRRGCGCAGRRARSASTTWSSCGRSRSPDTASRRPPCWSRGRGRTPCTGRARPVLGGSADAQAVEHQGRYRLGQLLGRGRTLRLPPVDQ